MHWCMEKILLLWNKAVTEWVNMVREFSSYLIVCHNIWADFPTTTLEDLSVSDSLGPRMKRLVKNSYASADRGWLCMYAEEQKLAVLMLNYGVSGVEQNWLNVSMFNDVTRKGQMIRDGWVLSCTQTFGGFSLGAWLDSL